MQTCQAKNARNMSHGREQRMEMRKRENINPLSATSEERRCSICHARYPGAHKAIFTEDNPVGANDVCKAQVSPNRRTMPAKVEEPSLANRQYFLFCVLPKQHLTAAKKPNRPRARLRNDFYGRTPERRRRQMAEGSECGRGTSSRNLLNYFFVH